MRQQWNNFNFFEPRSQKTSWNENVYFSFDLCASKCTHLSENRVKKSQKFLIRNIVWAEITGNSTQCFLSPSILRILLFFCLNSVSDNSISDKWTWTFALVRSHRCLFSAMRMDKKKRTYRHFMWFHNCFHSIIITAIAIIIIIIILFGLSKVNIGLLMSNCLLIRLSHFICWPQQKKTTTVNTIDNTLHRTHEGTTISNQRKKRLTFPNDWKKCRSKSLLTFVI